jgi:hypothetical protein
MSKLDEIYKKMEEHGKSMANPAFRELVLRSPRLAGLVGTGFGSFLFFVCAISPLMSAKRGQEIWFFSANVTAVSFDLIIISLSLLLGGKRAFEFFNPRPEQSKIPCLVLAVILIAAGYGCYFFIKTQIVCYGYVFSLLNRTNHSI